MGVPVAAAAGFAGVAAAAVVGAGALVGALAATVGLGAAVGAGVAAGACVGVAGDGLLHAVTTTIIAASKARVMRLMRRSPCPFAAGVGYAREAPKE